ncbi:hypothetical protein GDO81_024317 [Engystomops pustulosus]|nr:hypothetical protein GDO81_024317 [Engystomops pustulosus]
MNEDFTHRNESFPSMLKGCSRGLPCGTMPYAKNNYGIYFLMSLKCCNEDLCNNQTYEKPEPKEPSGISCMSCFKPDTVEGCDSDEKIQCYDKKDKCYRFSGIVMRPDQKVVNYSVRGCASGLLCRSDLGQLIGAKVLNTTSFNCTDPTQPPSETDKEGTN